MPLYVRRIKKHRHDNKLLTTASVIVIMFSTHIMASLRLPVRLSIPNNSKNIIAFANSCTSASGLENEASSTQMEGI